MFTPDRAAPVFLTGATGFLGSHVARAFHRAGYTDLRLLVRDGSKLGVVSDVPHTVVLGNLGDPASWAKGLEGAEGVVHLAADYSMWVRDTAQMHQTNVVATEQLARASLAAGVQRFVHCSSVAAIGRLPGTIHSDETVAWNLAWTKDPYTISKHAGEQAVKRVFAEGLGGVIVNPSAPIGPDDVRPTPTGQLIVDVLNRRVPGWFEGGFNIGDGEDEAEGFVLAYEKGRERENYILGGMNVTLRQLFLSIEDLTGVPAPALKLPNWAVVPAASFLEWWGNVTNSRPILTPGGARMVMLPPWYDDTKARMELGYTSRPFKATLERAIIYIYKRGWATPPKGSPMRHLLGIK